MSFLNVQAIPLGFGMALSQDLNAMDKFSHMTEAEKEEYLNRARDAKSKKDMSAIVSELSSYNQLS